MINPIKLRGIEVKIPRILPVLPLRDVVAFPLILPLFVGRQKSISAVEYALKTDKLIFLVAQRDINIDDPDPADLYSTGTVAIILRMIRLRDDDNRMKVLFQGLSKGRILDFIQLKPFYMANVERQETESSGTVIQATMKLMLEVKGKLDVVFNYGKTFPVEVMAVIENLTDPEQLAHLIAANLGLEPFRAQEILEINDPVKKLMSVSEILDEQTSLFKEGKAQNRGKFK
jgi:ATP-dependent Lon protease